jgi:drug/metabolite transporter (DMT)-like permease
VVRRGLLYYLYRINFFYHTSSTGQAAAPLTNVTLEIWPERRNMPNNNETPLISQGDVSPSKKQRVETTPTWVWMLVGVMVVLGTVNFVLLGTLYKAYTDEYAFFVNQGINFMYVFMGGMVLYPKQIFTNEINEKTGLRFSQRKLFFLGLLDSFGTLFTALGAVHTPNVIQPLLNQTLIPFTIIFSFIFLGARYHRFALAGATAIVIGASLTVFPCLTGS